MKYVIYTDRGILGFFEANSKEEVAKKLHLPAEDCSGPGEDPVYVYWHTPVDEDFTPQPRTLVDIIDVNELPEISAPYDLDEANSFALIR